MARRNTGDAVFDEFAREQRASLPLHKESAQHAKAMEMACLQIEPPVDQDGFQVSTSQRVKANSKFARLQEEQEMHHPTASYQSPWRRHGATFAIGLLGGLLISPFGSIFGRSSTSGGGCDASAMQI